MSQQAILARVVSALEAAGLAYMATGSVVSSLMGLNLYVSRPEDTILQKLRWAEMSGGSERQFGDALRVFEVQRASLDFEYMTRWVDRLGLQALWKRLLEEATP